MLPDPGAAPTAEVGTEANGPSLPRTGAAGTRVSPSPPCPRGLGDSPCHADGAVTERRRWAVGDRDLSGPATLRRALSGVGTTGPCTCALAPAGCPRGLTPTEGVGPSPQAPRGSCGRGSAGPSVALSALHGPQDVASAAGHFAQFTRKTRGLGPNREPWVSGHCVFLDLFQVVMGPAMGPQLLAARSRPESSDPRGSWVPAADSSCVSTFPGLICHFTRHLLSPWPPTISAPRQTDVCGKPASFCSHEIGGLRKVFYYEHAGYHRPPRDVGTQPTVCTDMDSTPALTGPVGTLPPHRAPGPEPAPAHQHLPLRGVSQ